MKTYLRAIILIGFIVVFSWTAFSQIFINEYSASNLNGFPDNYGYYEDWCEIYNAGSTSIDISGYFLTDDSLNLQKYEFRDGTSIGANSFLRIWFSGRDEVSGSHIHTNFKLTQTKDPREHIIISDEQVNVIDDVELQITQKEHSRGRFADGSDNWCVFTSPTPSSSNNSSTPYLKYADKPEMSVEAGFYTGGITVSITTTELNSTIRFTTDGAAPSNSSQAYSSPLSITSTTIVNARTYSSNPEILPGLIDFNTYFIDITHAMPVISASAADLDNLLNGNQSLTPLGTFEYFDESGERTNIAYGEYNEHGQDSWVHDQRSIDWITRDECGYNNSIKGNIIPLTDRQDFQRLILRAAGDDNYPGIDTSALLRDYFIQNTASIGGLNLDMRRGQKGVLYCNGNYWGVYGYREKVSDHDYTDYYYDQDKFNLYYLKLWGGSWAEYGGQPAWDDWNEIHDFILGNDMSNQENFEYVKSRYDYTSLIDYIHINSYVVCSDWINWNVGWWKGLNPVGGHQRWAYTLWDEDATFDHYINYTGVPGTHPDVSPCFPEGLSSDPEDHIEILNALIDNEEFNQYYVTRYIDLYNTTFHPDSMIPYLTSIEEYMEDEMSNHVARWGGSVNEWKNNVNKIRNFIIARHDFLPEGLSSCYGLNGPYDLTINVEPAGEGYVQLNSILHENLPWQGEYFGGIDNILKAFPATPNYEFDYWSYDNSAISPSDTLDEVLMELFDSDLITAHFREIQIVDSLVINEINYNSSPEMDAEDWVELYNPMDYSLDISGWIFKDSEDNHEYFIPDNTEIASHDFIVICRDTAMFHAIFPDVEDYFGDLGFGLSGGGELIRLFNSSGLLIDEVPYDDEEPWPLEADGMGPTLELTQTTYDNYVAQSWHASSENGTPGDTNGWPTSIEENAMASYIELEAVPNPFTNRTQINIGNNGIIKDGQLIIFDYLGHEVSRIEGINSGRITLDGSYLDAGFYIVRFVMNNQKETASLKLIVK